MKKLWPFLVIFLLVISHIVILFFLPEKPSLSTRDIRAAEKIFDLQFTPAEREMMLEGLKRNLQSYRTLREVEIPNSIPPALYFFPLVPDERINITSSTWNFSIDPTVNLPEDLEETAFYPVASLAQLIWQKKLTSLQLTELYLSRLKKYGPELECIITLMEDTAREQARAADLEIAAGRYRGPLHGIPWGAKDLLAARNAKTTWGAMPYKDQFLDQDATVVSRLHEAGAVLLAKLTLGALAMGDTWYGGQTRNPWNLEQGSSGSSAGSAAATSAGLVGFAIGTETLGSIVSPATRCGVSGLRPTFGRISRYGAMALSWSMDKIGPLCRTAEDCALVFDVLYGPDGKDPTLLDYPFEWDPELPLERIRIGYLESAFQRDRRNKEIDLEVLRIFENLGTELVAIELPEFPTGAMRFILSAEAAAAFDELTRSDRDDLLVRQNRGAWPNSFRQARFIPAVEYIQANRLRTMLMGKMAQLMENIDVFITPSYGGSVLLVTNLTGHPAVVVPNGFDEKGSPTSISFIGGLFQEAKLLRTAKAYQEATDFHLRHPDLEQNIARKKAADEEKAKQEKK